MTHRLIHALHLRIGSFLRHGAFFHIRTFDYLRKRHLFFLAQFQYILN